MLIGKEYKTPTEEVVFHRAKLSCRVENNFNLAPDIWKRLFPPRIRRPILILPQIQVGIRRRPNPGMEINLFRLCTGLKAIGYFMILLVAAIVSVSYYAVVVLTWGPELLRGGLHSVLAIVIIVLFHFLVILNYFSKGYS